MRLFMKDVRLLVDYLYQDERRHFEESGKSKRHIFRALERLRKQTEGKTAGAPLSVG